VSPAPPAGVTDLHVHVQPWRQLTPAVLEAMRRGHEDHWDLLVALMDDPRWGTDWPSPGVHDLGRNLEQFLSLELPDDVKTRITVENALKMFPST
jgi:hypothetical protein